MADNTELNPGSGGRRLRTLEDSNGVHWPTATVAYATSLAGGDNALQIVDPSHGLPVAVVGGVEVSQADETQLNATVFQGGSWVTQLAPGQTVGLAPGTEVRLADPVAVAGTVPVSIADPVAVAGSVAVDGPVAIAGTVPVEVSGPVGTDVSTVYDGPTALTPKFAKIAAAGSGDNPIVPAVPGKRIRVLRWGLAAAGDAAAKWRSGSTDLTGARKLTEYAAAGGAYCPVGVFETAPGEPLNLNLSAAVAVGGEITYVEV